MTLREHLEGLTNLNEGLTISVERHEDCPKHTGDEIDWKCWLLVEGEGTSCMEHSPYMDFDVCYWEFKDHNHIKYVVLKND